MSRSLKFPTLPQNIAGVSPENFRSDVARVVHAIVDAMNNSRVSFPGMGGTTGVIQAEKANALRTEGDVSLRRADKTRGQLDCDIVEVLVRQKETQLLLEHDLGVTTDHAWCVSTGQPVVFGPGDPAENGILYRKAYELSGISVTYPFTARFLVIAQ